MIRKISSRLLNRILDSQGGGGGAFFFGGGGGGMKNV